jgi:hypothetical protein
MSLRFKLITAMLLIAVGGAIASPWLIYYRRESQFKTVRDLIESNGGHLSFDLVDGNYMLDLSNATDQTVDQLLPTLLHLPTGFTFIGPGEDRHFWLTLNNASISDSGLEKLCDLHLSEISLRNCQNLTDASAVRLSKLAFTHVSIGEGVPFSDDATRRLQSSLGYWCVVPKRTE